MLMAISKEDARICCTNYLMIRRDRLQKILLLPIILKIMTSIHGQAGSQSYRAAADETLGL